MGVSRIIDGYIAKTILMCILLVVLVVTGLYVIFAFVSEASDIGSGNYGFWEAIWYVMLTIPANLALIAPVAGFLGSLIGLGYLANHSELIAMRSGGISIAQISKSVAKAAFWVGLITFFLSAFIGPWTSRLAMIEQISSKNNRSFLLTADSTWLKDGNDFIYIDHSTDQGNLVGVVRYELKDGQLTKIMSAGQAEFLGKAWHLNQVQVIQIKPSGVTEQVEQSAVWPDLIQPELLKVVVSDPGQLNLLKLFSYIRYRLHNHLDVRDYQLHLWQIIFQPLSVLVLMLMTVPFVFGPLRSSTAGFRIVIGVAMGFVFFLLYRFFGPLSMVLHISPFWGAALPGLVFLFLTCGLLWKMS